jgi:DNA-binding GntR family transcriptional regulator
VLRREIAAGLQPIGSCLPNEHELSARFSASRFTVRQALNGLREAGMIEPRRGKGTFVIATHPRAAFVQTLNSVEELLQYPGRTLRENQRSEMVRADARLAALLACPEGSDWVWLRATRRPEGSDLPISWLDAWIAERFAAVAGAPNPDGSPLLVQIERSFGQRAHHAQVQVMADRIPADLAPPLKVDPGAAAMVLLRRYRDAEGAVYLVTRSVHPEGRFSLNFEFQTT